jgi:hypothetical protein
MAQDKTKVCTKCNTPNPISNDYCRKCGAVLGVSTTLIQRAKSLLVLPVTKKMSWRWVGLGALIIIGMMSVFVAVLSLISWMILDFSSRTGSGDLGAIFNEFIGLSIVAATLFLAAFGFGGVLISWFAKPRTVFEPGLAAILVLVLLGTVASSLVDDAALLAGIMAVPAAILAWLGGRIGSIFAGKEGNR